MQKWCQKLPAVQGIKMVKLGPQYYKEMGSHTVLKKFRDLALEVCSTEHTEGYESKAR